MMSLLNMNQLAKRIRIFRLPVVVLTQLLLVGCTTPDWQPHEQSLTIMTYNVENLFDAIDDPDKQDETYLPVRVKKTARHRNRCQGLLKSHWRDECLKLDWSDRLIERKMGRLADVILQVNNGRGPDVLILQEVENVGVLERLRLNHLQAAGYGSALLLDGPDERGINVGMLSRLPQSAPLRLHELELDEVAKRLNKSTPVKTRGILEANFKLPDGENLTVLGVHFPSQGSPVEFREKGVETILQIAKNKGDKALIVVGGDFNITSAEDGRYGLISRKASENFWVSHEVGCDDCPGTHNYRGSWSFLDILLFSKSFKQSPWQLDEKSIRLANKSLYQINRWGGPERFNQGRGQKGVSDHWPLAADIYRQTGRSKR